MVKLETATVVCPACNQQVEAVTADGRVRGYCAVGKQNVDFVVKTQAEKQRYWQDPEYRAKRSAAAKRQWQDPEYRAEKSAAARQQWQDAEYRAKQRATRRSKGTGANPS